MCTALTLTTHDGYFGRNLDLEYHYREELTVVPRCHRLMFRHMPPLDRHHAFLGTAFIPDEYPLFYDAVNECGLAMAGLNFPHFAHYAPLCNGGVAPFELIPLVLARCATVKEACELLRHTPIVQADYSESLPTTPLHWCLADAHDCVAVEPLADGVHITEDPVGVLTNSPPLPEQLRHLASFTTLSPQSPPAVFGGAKMTLVSGGMGSEGLPGGYSSQARFVRAAFGRVHSVCDDDEESAVMQVFHLLDSVAMPDGSVVMPDGRCEKTVYSCCCNLRTGAYYYKTYNSSHIRAVDMYMDDIDGTQLYRRAMQDVFEVTV